MPNVDEKVVAGFGDEWTRFDQSALSDAERRLLFEQYFSVFPWDRLPAAAVGFDAGCGTGRWARLAAERVGKLHCVDPSAAIEVARRNLEGMDNCEFHRATVDELPFADGSMDFGYSLGVLHHIPDTAAGMQACVGKLKPGAPFLVYLYYAFDNRPWWFRWIWRVSDLVRRVIARSPNPVRYLASQVIAAFVYYPLARTAWLLEKCGVGVSAVPLSAYRYRSFYSMRTDALDRFGTRLERRFTRAEIERMMRESGLDGIEFSDYEPYWCAVGFRSR